jgi:NADPH-dependent glutamate synthase beta subunit-like oxidoreductase/NAD(P)H-flavin reductase
LALGKGLKCAISAAIMTALTLAHNLTFADLYTQSGLARLDGHFLDSLSEDLRAALLAARQTPPSGKDEVQLILRTAPAVEQFIATLFNITPQLAELQAAHHKLAPLYSIKRLFVQRRSSKTYTAEQANSFDGSRLWAQLGSPADELAFAVQVENWLQDESANAAQIEAAIQYAAWALHSEQGRKRHSKGILFQVPHKTDPSSLVDFVRSADGYISAHPHALRPRHGFDLTDHGTDLAGALDEATYCIWCAHQGKDSCSKGLRDKSSGQYLKNAAGITQAGCPLSEKISEFHELKTQGHPIAALAVICVDNPMVAGTGHRICNDCMKACIYQKQEPVDIPQAETRTLKDVLNLPWGYEIYSLLTRWNPLNFSQPVPLPASGRTVLVVGLGPAGYTLSHHLLNKGHQVLAIDGLKLEPLPQHLLTTPIHDVAVLQEKLSERLPSGFGGVAEYGITVRWDKNFLTLIRLLLERRAHFTAVSGVRFGSTGTIGLDDAFALGFDHVALCMGAGKPTIVDMKNNLAPGVRQASDFLMALQLTGAARAQSVANLQLELPVVVIGGGLTAIDTATEALAYYPVQVKKFATRYQLLVAAHGEHVVRAGWAAEEAKLADTYLAHHAALEAAADGLARTKLLQAWGGATIAYRKDITAAPSYTLNHEEVALALEEGIQILDHATPLEVLLDAEGHADGLLVDHKGERKTLKARSILVAAGTQPNTVLAREPMGTTAITLDGKYFQAMDASGIAQSPARVSKPGAVHVLMAQHKDGRSASFFGDLHPSFAGNVVKAMGSAKQGAPVLHDVLMQREPAARDADQLVADTAQKLRATLLRVERLTPTIVEVVVHAPFAAEKFEPGQFYRLQNFERLHGDQPALEGLALTGAWVDKAKGEVGMIVLEMGGSSSLCSNLPVGDPVVLMGPTGAPTEIPENETVLLIGGGLGNAVLFSIGKACRAKGNKVLYFAGYKKLEDRYKVADIELAADHIIWCCDEAPGFTPSRASDFTFHGNMLQAITAYAEGTLGPQPISTRDVDRLICIGSDRLMGAVAYARKTSLSAYFKPEMITLGSINSPMQCMMKEICAQCLQRHIDPVTGEEEIVFSCFNQDQPLERVDFNCLHDRLSQNSLWEKLTAHWLRYSADRQIKAA